MIYFRIDFELKVRSSIVFCLSNIRDAGFSTSIYLFSIYFKRGNHTVHFKYNSIFLLLIFDTKIQFI